MKRKSCGAYPSVEIASLISLAYSDFHLIIDANAIRTQMFSFAKAVDQVTISLSTYNADAKYRPN